MDGSQVWDAYRDGRIADIRNYCETDVMNTWLVYCRFQMMRGVLSPAAFEGRGREGARVARRTDRAALASIPRRVGRRRAVVMHDAV